MKRNFPSKLHALLTENEPTSFSWIENGKCFLIRDAQLFSILLGRYFKTDNVKSFQRQLNFYGFKRINVVSSLASHCFLNLVQILF